MKTWSDSILTFVARVSDSLGPATRMLDAVMDRVVTTQTAKADVCGGFGWYYCPNLSQCIFAYACPESDLLDIKKYVQVSVSNCHNFAATTCTLDVCDC